MLGTRKKQTIPASRASRLVHPQAMGTILVPHSNTSISYNGGPLYSDLYRIVEKFGYRCSPVAREPKQS